MRHRLGARTPILTDEGLHAAKAHFHKAAQQQGLDPSGGLVADQALRLYLRPARRPPPWTMSDYVAQANSAFSVGSGSGAWSAVVSSNHSSGCSSNAGLVFTASSAAQAFKAAKRRSHDSPSSWQEQEKEGGQDLQCHSVTRQSQSCSKQRDPLQRSVSQPEPQRMLPFVSPFMMQSCCAVGHELPSAPGFDVWTSSLSAPLPCAAPNWVSQPPCKIPTNQTGSVGSWQQLQQLQIGKTGSFKSFSSDTKEFNLAPVAGAAPTASVARAEDTSNRSNNQELPQVLPQGLPEAPSTGLRVRGETRTKFADGERVLGQSTCTAERVAAGLVEGLNALISHHCTPHDPPCTPEQLCMHICASPCMLHATTWHSLPRPTRTT